MKTAPRTVLHLRRDEAAVLCLLLLRGPQTPGELRSRADRLHTFDDVPAVLSTLHRLAVPADTPRDPLVTALPRQPGSREQRYTHLLCGAPPAEASAATAAQASPRPSLADLERRVDALERALARAGVPLHED